MKVFMGWSGDISHAIARELREWLPSVIQSIDSWISSEDIRKGVPWGPAIAKELADAKAGVFCLTHENFKDPWINFEAGAVSNTPWSAHVCTYLFGVASSGITGPLTQFQGTIATSKEDNLRLLATINSAQAEGALDQKRLERAFEKYWPELETKLAKISDAKHPTAPKRPIEDMVEETLDRLRDLQQKTAALQAAAQRTYEPIRYMVDSSPSFSPLAQYANLVALGTPSAPHTPIMSSEGPAFYTRPLTEELLGLGPQSPPAVQPPKPNNPKKK